MLNYKTIIVLCFATWLCSCKPGAKSFSYKYNVDTFFFNKTLALAGLDGIDFDSIKIYKATLLERLVEKDKVPEYSLINTKSHQQYANLADTKGKSLLYLFQLFPGGDADTVFVYMATGYSPKGFCNSIGPVYLGFGDMDRIHFSCILKIKAPKKTKYTVNKEVFKRYDIDKKDDSTHIIFYNDQSFPAPADRKTPIRIKQIIKDITNKIGGNKAVIFTTEKVFEDSNALVFTYDSTIIKKKHGTQKQ